MHSCMAHSISIFPVLLLAMLGPEQGPEPERTPVRWRGEEKGQHAQKRGGEERDLGGLSICLQTSPSIKTHLITVVTVFSLHSRVNRKTGATTEVVSEGHMARGG